MSVAYPWLLALIPVLAFFMLRKPKLGKGLPVPSLRSWDHVDQGRARYLWVLRALRFLAVALLLVALARPQAGTTKSMQVTEGIAIQMLVDVSSSMDMNLELPDGGKRTRMEVSKELVEDFIVGDGDKLKGRADDLIGLITFARYPDTRCPLTFGHPALLQLVRSLTVQDRPNEDGTAYGDALALAAARLKHLDEMEMEDQSLIAGEVTSRVIVLLTDGENNSGNHLPLEAAGLAKQWGHKVYTISLGDPQDSVAGSSASLLSPAEKVLEHISRETGGVFRKAHDYDSLKGVYEEIDKLERSKISARNFNETSEWFWLPLAAGLLALLAGMILEATLLHTTP
ncbi:VWA domain-containing protein [Haloferula sp.]|uniref:VWA domain-containing protein n=1 Tax=Haloferula sp. TaxID=2497595 RepID=UPI00329F3E65